MSTPQLPENRPQSERPPAETFWKRFSPNHELPLASASSVVLHMLFVLLVALFGATVFSDRGARIPDGGNTFRWPTLGTKGGGGEPDGNSDRLFAPASQKELAELEGRDTGAETPPMPALPSVSPINPPKGKETALKNRVESSRGKKGPGSGLGEGDGHGPDKGGGISEPTRDSQVARQERWTLNFEYTTGDDYLLQLKSLGAIVAVPYRDEQFRLYRDLGKRPFIFQLVGQRELNELGRIHWENGESEAARLLAFALGIDGAADSFRVYFPQELQDDLAKKERAASGGRDISQIKQTIFKVTRRGKTCEVQVIGQELTR